MIGHQFVDYLLSVFDFKVHDVVVHVFQTACLLSIILVLKVGSQSGVLNAAAYLFRIFLALNNRELAEELGVQSAVHVRIYRNKQLCSMWTFVQYGAP